MSLHKVRFRISQLCRIPHLLDPAEKQRVCALLVSHLLQEKGLLCSSLDADCCCFAYIGLAGEEVDIYVLID